MTTNLKRGDIFLTQGSNFISRGIRFFSRSGGEARTKANHVGLVVAGGTEHSSVIVEAVSRVKRHRMRVYAESDSQKVAVFRPKNLTQAEIDAIVAKAESYVGARYGYGKIVAHFLDWCLGGRYFFRRFARMDNYPICSWLVAWSYYDGAGKDFGVEPGAASPDDIMDFCEANPDKYELIHPMGRI